MLEPNHRQLLLDCLQPPDGFELDQAVGSTYSLDLYALLSVPVAFSFRAAMSEEGGADPLARLEALRRFAERVHVFCQAGEIHVPGGQEQLFAYLEDSVIGVVPVSESGVFHPKAWFLRFTGANDAVVYRFICLSRNLTFDRSWDTALVLDGQLESVPASDPNPAPLADFVRCLPDLAKQSVRTATRQTTEQMAAELPRVHFDCPPGIESMRFWPMGIGNHQPPRFMPAHRRLLVASPFVSESWLQRQCSGREKAYLISREDQLLGLSEEARAPFETLYTLVQEATPEEDVEAQGEDEHLLSGLHAKLFVMDDGWSAHAWTGSANATEAAFHHNVEMLVQLSGKKSHIGIDALVGTNDKPADFRELLEVWQAPSEAPAPVDGTAEQLDEQLWSARRSFASAALGIQLAAYSDQQQYNFAVDGEWPALPTGIVGRLWPIGLTREQARPLNGEAVAFEAVTLEAVSAFIAIELTATGGGETRQSRFVLRLPIEGLPDDRASRLLRHMLADRQAFMRLLMLLLADDGGEALITGAVGNGQWHGGNWLAGGGDAPVLESLLQSLDRAPERIDRIQNLIDDLSTSGDPGELLPDGFLEIWDAIRANRDRA